MVINYAPQELKGAAKSWQSCVAMNPQDMNACIQLGVIFYYLGKFKDAIAQYQKAMDLDSNLAEPYYFLGLVVSEQGEMERAISYCSYSHPN